MTFREVRDLAEDGEVSLNRCSDPRPLDLDRDLLTAVLYRAMNLSD